MTASSSQPQQRPELSPELSRGGGHSKKVWRSFLVHALEVAALLLALAIAVCGGLAWRLSQGPISLGFLRADAEAALVEVFAGEQAHIGILQASWSPDERTIVFAARDVQVLDGAGRVLVQAPRFDVGVSGLGLVQGKTILRSVIAVGGEFSLRRRMDGAVGAGIGLPDQVKFGNVNNALAANKDGQPSIPELLGRLQVFAVRDAILHFVDERSGIDWVAPNANARFSRDGDQIIAFAEGQIESAAGITGISIDANSRADFTRMSAQLSLVNVVPAALVPPGKGALQMLSAVDAPLDATIVFATGEDGLLRAADGEIIISAGVYRNGEQEVLIEGAQLILAFDPIAAMVNIQSASLQTAAVSTKLQGNLTGLDPANLAVGQTVGFDLTFEDMVINPPGVFAQPVAVNRVRLDGEFLPATGHASFRNFSLSVFELAFHGDGAFTFPNEGMDEDDPLLVLNARSEGQISPRQVVALWPVDFAKGGRDWIDRNVLGALLHDFTLDMQLPQGVRHAPHLENDMLSLSFSFDEAASHFVHAMTPLRTAEGTAVLQGNRFDLVLESGRIINTELTDGFVEIPRLSPKGVTGNFGAHTQGPLTDVVHLLDEKPLEFISRYGLSPDAITGLGEMDFVVHRPMRVDVPVRKITFSAKGNYDAIKVAGLVAGQDFSEGVAAFLVDEEGMNVEGEGRLGLAQGAFTWKEKFFPENEPRTQLAIDVTTDSSLFDELGIPTRLFLDGPVKLHVETSGAGLSLHAASLEADLTEARLMSFGGDWEKPAGQKGQAKFNIKERDAGGYEISDIKATTEGFILEGDLSIAAEGGLRRAHISRAQMSEIFDFSADLQRDEDGAFVITGHAAQLDARGFVRGLSSGTNANLAIPVSAEIVFDRALVSDEMILKNGSMDFKRSAEEFEILTFAAETPNGTTSFVIAPDEEGRRQLQGRADDAGLFIEALFGAANVSGGVLEMQGALGDDNGKNTKIEITMNDFKLGNVPAFARVLSLGSLTGIANTMGGEGLAFKTLYAPLEFENGKMKIGEARATGPALGVTVSGTVDQVEKSMKLSGALAPAYALNSALGNIPLLGKVLVSRKGEGVFGLSFRVQGPFDTLQVFVNPLSALTPGFLRRMFEGDSRASFGEQNRPETLNAGPEIAAENDAKTDGAPDSAPVDGQIDKPGALSTTPETSEEAPMETPEDFQELPTTKTAIEADIEDGDKTLDVVPAPLKEVVADAQIKSAPESELQAEPQAEAEAEIQTPADPEPTSLEPTSLELETEAEPEGEIPPIPNQ